MVSRYDLKRVVIDSVTSRQGCKATELCVDEIVVKAFVEYVAGCSMTREQAGTLPDLLEELVKEGNLVEVEYVLPMLDCRIKSFLLPANTKVMR